MSALQRILSGRIIPFHTELGKALGGVLEALFVAQLAFWSERMETDEGFVQISDEQLAAELLISPKQTRRIRAKLSRMEVLKYRRRGIPARMSYWVNFDALESLLFQKATTTPSLEDSPAAPIGKDLPLLEMEERSPIIPQGKNGYSPEFDTFWEAWPDHKRKRDPGKVYKKWKSLALDDRLPEILKSLRGWKIDWAKDGDQFIPGPHPWLHQRNFEVDPSALMDGDLPRHDGFDPNCKCVTCAGGVMNAS